MDQLLSVTRNGKTLRGLILDGQHWFLAKDAFGIGKQCWRPPLSLTWIKGYRLEQIVMATGLRPVYLLNERGVDEMKVKVKGGLFQNLVLTVAAFKDAHHLPGGVDAVS